MGRISDAQAQANFILSRQPQNEEAPLLLAEASLTHTDIEAAQRRLQALARGGDRAALELALGSLACAATMWRRRRRLSSAPKLWTPARRRCIPPWPA